MKWNIFKKKNKSKVSKSNSPKGNDLNAKCQADNVIKVSRKSMFKAARAARKARRKASDVQKRPFTRLLSLVLAGLMLFGFVSGAAVLVWNFFFPSRQKSDDLSNLKLKQMLDSLAKLKEQTVEDEAQPVDEGSENEEDEVSDESEENGEASGGENTGNVKKEKGNSSENELSVDEKKKAAEEVDTTDEGDN